MVAGKRRIESLSKSGLRYGQLNEQNDGDGYDDGQDDGAESTIAADDTYVASGPIHEG